MTVNGFKWDEDLSKFDEAFKKHDIEKSKGGYFLKFFIQYQKESHELHIDLQFLPERMKIEKIEKRVANLRDENDYVIHINIKSWIKSLNH